MKVFYIHVCVIYVAFYLLLLHKDVLSMNLLYIERKRLPDWLTGAYAITTDRERTIVCVFISELFTQSRPHFHLSIDCRSDKLS